MMHTSSHTRPPGPSPSLRAPHGSPGPLVTQIPSAIPAIPSLLLVARLADHGGCRLDSPPRGAHRAGRTVAVGGVAVLGGQGLDRGGVLGGEGYRVPLQHRVDGLAGVDHAVPPCCCLSFIHRRAVRALSKSPFVAWGMPDRSRARCSASSQTAASSGSFRAASAASA